jgi:hypothetical protein
MDSDWLKYYSERFRQELAIFILREVREHLDKYLPSSMLQEIKFVNFSTLNVSAPPRDPLLPVNEI